MSRSENRANLYLSHKDHKKEQDKTRPIGTACTSNTRAFANSVSELLEAVANSGENKFEVISSEDLLHHTKKSNSKTKQIKAEIQERREKKRKCWKCKLWRIGCRKCEVQPRPHLVGGGEAVQLEAKQGVQPPPHRKGGGEADHHQLQPRPQLRNRCGEVTSLRSQTMRKEEINPWRQLLKPPKIRLAEAKTSKDQNLESGRKPLPPLPQNITTSPNINLGTKPLPPPPPPPCLNQPIESPPSTTSSKLGAQTSTLSEPTPHPSQQSPSTEGKNRAEEPSLFTRKLTSKSQPPPNITGGRQGTPLTPLLPQTPASLTGKPLSLPPTQPPTPCNQSDNQESKVQHHDHRTRHLPPPLPQQEAAQQEFPTPCKQSDGREQHHMHPEVQHHDHHTGHLPPTLRQQAANQHEFPTPCNPSDSQELHHLHTVQHHDHLTSHLLPPLPQQAVHQHALQTLPSSYESPRRSLTSQSTSTMITNSITNYMRKSPSYVDNSTSASTSPNSPLSLKKKVDPNSSSPSPAGAHVRSKPEKKEKNKNKNKLKPVRNQPNISEAFKKIIEKKIDSLPGPEAARRMWENLDMAVEKKDESEKEKSSKIKIKIEKKSTTIEPENVNKTTTTTTQNKITKQKHNNKLNEKPKKETNEAKAKPNLNLRVKGKQISDIETLRDFLAKKKLERATKSMGGADASHTQRRFQLNERDQPIIQGEKTQEKEGLEFDAAKGTTVSSMTDVIGQNKPRGCD